MQFSKGDKNESLKPTFYKLYYKFISIQKHFKAYNYLNQLELFLYFLL